MVPRIVDPCFRQQGCSRNAGQPAHQGHLLKSEFWGEIAVSRRYQEADQQASGHVVGNGCQRASSDRVIQTNRRQDLSEGVAPSLVFQPPFECLDLPLRQRLDVVPHPGTLGRSSDSVLRCSAEGLEQGVDVIGVVLKGIGLRFDIGVQAVHRHVAHMID